MKKNITILGSGIAGLSVAEHLAETRKYNVTIVSRYAPATLQTDAETVSPIAGGLVFPYEVTESPQVMGWLGKTFQKYISFAKKGRAGVSMKDCTQLFRTTNPKKPEWKDIVQNFRTETSFPKGYKSAFSFKTPVVNTHVYTRWLVEKLKASEHVTFVTEEIRDPKSYTKKCDALISALGLGAKKLFPGEFDDLYPIRGDLLRVETPPGLDRCWIDIENSKELTYIIQRGEYTFIGGTNAKNDWDMEGCATERAKFFERAQKIAPELKGTIGTPVVGLRPASKSGVILRAQPYGNCQRIDLNGLGGSGWTLAPACGPDVEAMIH